jgi:hypothetical protein
MVEETFTKEVAKKLMALEGEARGVTLKADGEFVLKENGEEALKRVEDKLAEVGYPIEYRKIEPMTFYPIGTRAISLVAMREVLNLKDEDFRRVGEFESKFSLIVRLFMKYFFSIESMIEKGQSLWRKYYSVGDLTIHSYDLEKKQGYIKIENFNLHSIQCRILEGFFASMIKMIVKSEVSAKEIKCPFRGDAYHEYFIKW